MRIILLLALAATLRAQEPAFHLDLSEPWRIHTDGVVEATNARGELFGFERAKEISTKSAQGIAEAARAWGQNDHITVAMVRRAA
jgi:hypothetical protein